jgi:RimJ/RimL family protein N-acetyltransferase
MRGISEANVLKILSSRYAEDGFVPVSMLLNAIEELNTWKPIDENTPKDKWLPIIDEAKDTYIGKLSSRYGLWYVDIGVHVVPTHWQELPTLPKEK